MSTPIPGRWLVGLWRTPDDQPVAGRVRFLPSATVLDSAGGVVVAQVPVEVELDPTGYLEVELPVTDTAGLQPAGWRWQCSELFAGGREFAFMLPGGAGSIDLADIAPAQPVDESWQWATLGQADALDARVTAVESSAAVVTAAVIVHPYLLMGA